MQKALANIVQSLWLQLKFSRKEENLNLMVLPVSWVHTYYTVKNNSPPSALGNNLGNIKMSQMPSQQMSPRGLSTRNSHFWNFIRTQWFSRLRT